MNEQWFAIARGLKCLAWSLKATMLALILVIVGVVFDVFSRFAMSGGCFEIFSIPASLLAIAGFAYSLAGRLYLLRVPAKVRNARFHSMAALTFESISQASLGAYIVFHVWIMEVPRYCGIAWMGATALVGIAGMVVFFRFVQGLLEHFELAESMHEWRVVRHGWIWILIVVAMAVAVSRLRGELAFLLCLLLIILVLLLLGGSMGKYLRVVNSLRFSALREAVRCERDGDGIG